MLQWLMDLSPSSGAGQQKLLAMVEYNKIVYTSLSDRVWVLKQTNNSLFILGVMLIKSSKQIGVVVCQYLQMLPCSELMMIGSFCTCCHVCTSENNAQWQQCILACH